MSALQKKTTWHLNDIQRSSNITKETKREKTVDIGLPLSLSGPLRYDFMSGGRGSSKKMWEGGGLGCDVTPFTSVGWGKIEKLQI